MCFMLSGCAYVRIHYTLYYWRAARAPHLSYSGEKSSSYIYIYILLLLLLLLIIEHTTEGAEYYLVWGGDVERGMNGRGGGGGGDSSGSCNCSQHLLYVRLSASDIKPTHR